MAAESRRVRRGSRISAWWRRTRRRSRARSGPQRLARGAALTLAVFLLATALPVLALRWIDPWTSAFMVDARVESALDGNWRAANAYEWRDLERMSIHAAVAVIAAEDQLFASHAGFDFKSIREAVRANAKSRRVRGASTISQQVAKNLFLWSGRSWLRKGLEAWFTVLIEAAWPKERILEVYLNVAEFGPRTYGVQAAAQRFWKKDATRLSRRDSALLAAVLPNPRLYRVDRPSRYVLARRERILGQMRAIGGPSYLKQFDEEAASTR
jgi:monofunctional glycosyltransferase